MSFTNDPLQWIKKTVKIVANDIKECIVLIAEDVDHFIDNGHYITQCPYDNTNTFLESANNTGLESEEESSEDLLIVNKIKLK
jgi:hypothetical protein